MTKSEKNNNGGFLGTGLATYARVGATVAGVLGVILLITMIMNIVKDFRDKHTSSVAGNVVSVQCDDKYLTTCKVTASYSVGDNPYTVSGEVISTHKYTVGEQINVQYNPQDASDAVFEMMNPRKDAYLTMSFALLLILVAGINIYFIFKSKSFASIVGGLSILSIIVAILRRK